MFSLIHFHYRKGRRGLDRVVVEFINTYTISAYHWQGSHWNLPMPIGIFSLSDDRFLVSSTNQTN
jgi:hypothetical protein